MTTLTIKIPDNKTGDLSTFVKKVGGEIVAQPEKTKKVLEDEDNEVTHEVFFGENIKRLIKAFS